MTYICFLVVVDEASGVHGGEKGIAGLLDDSKGTLLMSVQVKLKLTFSCVSLIYAYVVVTVGFDKKLVSLSDQVSSDSSIPLSPQWLYSKPVDARATANPVGVCDTCCFNLTLIYQQFFFPFVKSICLVESSVAIRCHFVN